MGARIEGPRQKEAYREFLKLGVSRSIPALHSRLIELWGDPDGHGGVHVPSPGTLSQWSSQFQWHSRVIEDDEVINRRVLERLRDRQAQDILRRRDSRLHLSDIQLAAVTAAMLEKVKDEDGREIVRPRDLNLMDPQQIRAFNDTARTAGETQRIDGGEVTTRFGQVIAEDGVEIPNVIGDQAVLDDLAQFVGIVNDEAGDGDEVEETLALPAPIEETE